MDMAMQMRQINEGLVFNSPTRNELLARQAMHSSPRRESVTGGDGVSGTVGREPSNTMLSHAQGGGLRFNDENKRR
jgi:hypothetical protein